MWKDPIVQEVRKAGEKLAQKANYNVHIFFQNLRKNEKNTIHKKRLVSGKTLIPECK